MQISFPGAKKATDVSLRGLDWFVFFIADIQTGFGPFLSIYLTTQKWTQVDIAIILSMGTAVALLGQLPGGWLVDYITSKRAIAYASVLAIAISALLIAIAPVFAVIAIAKIVHILASCILGPAVASITLGMVGHDGIGARLGRNARFASLGSGISAMAMGWIGYIGTAQTVFFVTAALMLPAVVALNYIRPIDIDPQLADGNDPVADPSRSPADLSTHLFRRKPIYIFSACLLLFQFGNAAMLPLVGSDLTLKTSRFATLLIAACIIGPQLIVAACAPSVGRLSEIRGRRPVFLLGLCVVPVRAAILAYTNDPATIVVAQLLDGITAAALGVTIPAIVADISKGTGHFNLAQGVAGSATGIGATLSLLVSGYLSDNFGSHIAFAGLALAGVSAFVLAYALLPETAEHTAHRPHR